MDDAAVKEIRHLLRQAQEHLYLAQINLGAQRETLGLVDVIHHPTNPIPDMNYVSPRRNTAWVAGNFVQQGLNRLTALGRTPRVQYIEGLYPPLFAKTLRDLGLEAERETPLMIYKVGGIPTLTDVSPPPASQVEPEGTHIEIVSDQRGLELWWYVWRNAFYDVLTLGVEPLVVGRDMAAIHMGQQIDILLHRQQFPVGVARVSLQPENHTGHIVALALLREVRSPELIRLLYTTALQTALERGCELIFAPGESEEDRELCRTLNFVDVGSMMCYVQRTDPSKEEDDNGILAQPVLALR
jgi:hypothetical protein